MENFKKTMTRNIIFEKICAVSVYMLITAIMTYPLVLNLSSKIAGQWDGWFYVWDLWWWKYSVLILHSSPYYTNYIFYPIGTNFAYAGGGVITELIGIPLQNIFNVIATYNILILFSYVASAFGMYLLVRYLTGNGSAAFISGLIFSFSQYRFRMTEYGELTLISTQWMPLYILFLIKIFRHRKKSDAIFAGIFFSLNALSSWYYAIYAIIFTILFTGYEMANTKNSNIFFDKDLFGKLTIMIFSSSLILIPFLYPMFTDYNKERIMDVSVSIGNSADIFGYFVTGISPITNTGHPIFKIIPDLSLHITDILKKMGEGYGSEAYIYSFLGYSVLLLTFYTIIKIRLQDIKFWIISASSFFILSLGPVLHIFGKTEFFGTRILLPGYLLTQIPILSMLAKPSRFTIMLVISIAIICGYGLKDIFSRKRYTKIIFSTFSVIFLFEMLLIPFFLNSTIIPKAYNDIANEKGNFAIVEVPYTSDFYQYYQTFHNKKLIWGYMARPPAKVQEFIKNNSVLSKLNNPHNDNMKSVDEIRKDIESLKRNNIRYIIIHPSFFIWDKNYGQDYNLSELTEFLNSTVGKPQYRDGTILYRID
jgi:hypothetical protein